MRIVLCADELQKEGLEIGVIGFRDNPETAPEHPSQVFIELFEGQVRVFVWNGESVDATATVDIPALELPPI